MDKESWMVIGVAAAIVIGFVVADNFHDDVMDTDDSEQRQPDVGPSSPEPAPDPPSRPASPPPQPEPRQTPEPTPQPVVPAPPAEVPETEPVVPTPSMDETEIEPIPPPQAPDPTEEPGPEEGETDPGDPGDTGGDSEMQEENNGSADQPEGGDDMPENETGLIRDE